jgi:hypothetical protein
MEDPTTMDDSGVAPLLEQDISDETLPIRSHCLSVWSLAGQHYPSGTWCFTPTGSDHWLVA